MGQSPQIYTGRYNHAALIDRDEATYTEQSLREMKATHEAAIADELASPHSLGLNAPTTESAPDDPLRIAALDRLWEAVLTIRNGIPRVLADLDVRTDDEYLLALTSSPLPKGIDNITEDTIARSITLRDSSSSIEAVRPHTEESLWKLFNSYQLFLVRVCLVTAGIYAKRGPWFRDDVALRLLGGVLDPAVVKTIASSGIGRFLAAQSACEAALLTAIRRSR